MATLETTADLLRSQLERVEEALEVYSRSEIEALEASARHILCAGGKRLRPRIVLLAARAVGGDLDRAVPLAAAAELVHTATLVHDDIVDESDSRRGRTAVQFCFGNSASVLMGDFLVVRAFGILADDGDPRFWRLLVETIRRMCEGEVLQICIKGDTTISVEVYETVIECKTALLMGTCGQFGGSLGDADPEVVAALAEFGINAGMAFQIADDILDYTGSEEQLGKPVGGDLRERKVTLPVIFALESASAEDRTELLRLYEKTGPLSTADVEHARAILRRAGGFARARDHALGYIDRAQAALARVPRSDASDALYHLAEQVVDRRV